MLNAGAISARLPRFPFVEMLRSDAYKPSPSADLPDTALLSITGPNAGSGIDSLTQLGLGIDDGAWPREQ